jgi:membrane protease YdiL (CAAX protease family)
MIVGLFLAELTFSITPQFGFLLYAILVGGVLISLGYAEELGYRARILIYFMILPMVRIVEIFITLSLFWRTLLVYLALLFLVLFYLYRFESKTGFTKQKINWLPLVMVLGLGIGFAGNYFFGLDKHREILILIPLIAFAEEILFRGLIQREIKDHYSNIEGIFISAALYFIFAISFGWMIAGFFFFVSLINAIIYDRTENIWLCIALNACVNAMVFVL